MFLGASVGNNVLLLLAEVETSRGPSQSPQYCCGHRSSVYIQRWCTLFMMFSSQESAFYFIFSRIPAYPCRRGSPRYAPPPPEKPQPRNAQARDSGTHLLASSLDVLTYFLMCGSLFFSGSAVGTPGGDRGSGFRLSQGRIFRRRAKGGGTDRCGSFRLLVTTARIHDTKYCWDFSLLSMDAFLSTIFDTHARQRHHG